MITISFGTSNRIISILKSFPQRLASILFIMAVVTFNFQQVQAGIFNQTIINKAAAVPLLNFANDLQNSPMPQANAIYFMALVVHQDPTATYGTSNILVRNRLLEQFRSLITPGSEPNAASALAGWTHGQISQAFALAKNTPTVWSQLTSTEITKIDWIMKALAIAGHYGYDDGNDYRTDLHRLNDFNKKSNPNYVVGSIGVMIGASVYFGSAELNNIFTSFNFSTYMSQFTTYNWTNLINCWNSRPSPGWGPILENGGDDPTSWGTGRGTGVKNTFTYKNIGLDQPFLLHKSVANYFWGVTNRKPWTTSSNVIDGLTISNIAYSWTLNGGTSPYLGQPGVGYEFHATDGGSNTPRSNIHYVADTWNNDVCARSLLQEMGLWAGNVDSLADAETKMFVGSEDFLYKASQGFRGYSSGAGKANVYEADLVLTRGTDYVKEIWQKTMKNKVVTSSSTWKSFNISTQTGPFTAEFDAVPNKNVMNGVIGIQNGTASEYADQACAVRFYSNGKIEARSGSGYATSTVNYTFGTRYHFRFEIDIAAHTYTAFVKPAGGTEVKLGSNLAFRTEQASITQFNGWSIVNSSTTAGTVRVTNMKFTSVINEPFDDLTDITVVSGGTWSIVNSELQLSNPAPSNATTTPANIIVKNSIVSGDFVMKVKAKVTGTTAVHNDFCVIWNHQNPTNSYYYAHFGETNDDAGSGIFKVVNGVKSAQLADISTALVANSWNDLEVKKTGTTMTISLNGTQVAEITDASLSNGKVGLGSYNDACQFDDLYVEYNTSYTPGLMKVNDETLILTDNIKSTNSTIAIDIYPNPAIGTFNLSVGEEFIGSSILVYNTSGKKLYSGIASQRVNKVQLNGSFNGIAIVQIEKNGNRAVKKVIFQK